MSDNAAISGNIANYGGGGVARDSPIKRGKITENPANKGGRIVGSATKMENVEVLGNKAEYDAGVYITIGRYKNSKVTVTGGKITNDTFVTGNRAGEDENVFENMFDNIMVDGMFSGIEVSRKYALEDKLNE
jgi:hypothetical protein